MATIAEARPDLVERLVNPEDLVKINSGRRGSAALKCNGLVQGNPEHPTEYYTQTFNTLLKGLNQCPRCSAHGAKNKVKYTNPELVSRFVNIDDAASFTPGAYKKALVWCDGTVVGRDRHEYTEYLQAVRDLTLGRNGCKWCGHLGSSTSIKNKAPGLYDRLTNKDRDGSITIGSNKSIELWCDGAVQGNDHHDYTTYVHSASEAMTKNGCPVCNRTGSAHSIKAKYPEYLNRLVNESDGDIRGRSPKAVEVWCDGLVVGNTAHTRITYQQSVKYLTSGHNGCMLCSNQTKKIRDKMNFVLEGIIDHIENLSGAQKMALVLRRHGIKPGSPVGQAVLKNDVQALKDIMADLGAEDKDESELADLVSSGSGEEDFLVPDAVVEDSVSDDSLPTVTTKEGFAALEALSEISIGSDESAVRFLVDSAVHRLWQMLYAAGDVQAYIREVREKLDNCSNDYMCEFLGEFLRQYDEASALEVPERWGFYEPNLMQKHMALLVGERKLVGNWSGTGAGKTASAILSAMVGDREHILVVCPNNTVKGWKETIEVCDPDAEVLTKTFKPKWSNEPGSKWLVVNFDKFSGSEESALKMMQDVEFDMLVIDELHWVKERGGTQVSQRRETLRRVRSEMPEDSFVLGMSATPVVNDLSEGRSLIGLIDGRDPDFDTRPNLNNVQALHENMVRVGFRAIIPPKVGFDGEEFIDVDITHIKDELLVPGISHVTVDAIVAMEFAETITELAREAKARGKGVMVYTEYLTGIDEPLTQYLRGEGLRVAHFTGSHEKADIGSLVGNFDVLIGTQAIGTGVDGVQKWADTVVYATLPWTSAQFEQSRARVYRQGSTAETVRVVIPRGVVYLEDDKEWSWTDARWNRIKSKKDLASAAVDGEFPEHVVSSPKEATTAALAMLERMS